MVFGVIRGLREPQVYCMEYLQIFKTEVVLNALASVHQTRDYSRTRRQHQMMLQVHNIGKQRDTKEDTRKNLYIKG